MATFKDVQNILDFDSFGGEPPKEILDHLKTQKSGGLTYRSLNESGLFNAWLQLNVVVYAFLYWNVYIAQLVGLLIPLNEVRGSSLTLSTTQSSIIPYRIFPGNPWVSILEQV